MSWLWARWPLPCVCSQAEQVRVAALFHYLIGKGFLLFAWITDTGSFGTILDFICRCTLDMIMSKDNDNKNKFICKLYTGAFAQEM